MRRMLENAGHALFALGGALVMFGSPIGYVWGLVYTAMYTRAKGGWWLFRTLLGPFFSSDAGNPWPWRLFLLGTPAGLVLVVVGMMLASAAEKREASAPSA